MAFQRIGIVGSGAWGTALAVAAHRAGRDVVLWARDANLARTLAATRENAAYLPGVALDPAIRVSADLDDSGAAEVMLLAVPAQHLRAACRALASRAAPGAPAVICAKGIEAVTGSLMSEVASAELAGRPLAVLSGPTFAGEVARGLPTAVTLATEDQALGRRLVEALGSRTFRPYLSADVVGAEVGGAAKNVLAIACGIVVGRALGDNARAALITRGLAEMVRLGLALGARAETLVGLSGLGDLTLTCTSLQSRNMSLGMALGAGRRLEEVLAERRSIAEGVASAAAVVGRAARHGVEMPIAAAVDAILNRGADIGAAIAALLARPFRAEGA